MKLAPQPTATPWTPEESPFPTCRGGCTDGIIIRDPDGEVV